MTAGLSLKDRRILESYFPVDYHAEGPVYHFFLSQSPETIEQFIEGMIRMSQVDLYKGFVLSIRGGFSSFTDGAYYLIKQLIDPRITRDSHPLLIGNALTALILSVMDMLPENTRDILITQLRPFPPLVIDDVLLNQERPITVGDISGSNRRANMYPTLVEFQINFRLADRCTMSESVRDINHHISNNPIYYPLRCEMDYAQPINFANPMTINRIGIPGTIDRVRRRESEEYVNIFDGTNRLATQTVQYNRMRYMV